MSSPLKQNTTTIQELINTINSLPEAENLDTELNTQATLLSEQDAKIAELAEILSAKAGGSTAPGGSSTISVTISDKLSQGGTFYFDENGMVKTVFFDTETVNALSGIVFTRMPTDTIAASGNYIPSDAGAVNAVRFLEDGGTASIS